MQRQRYRGMASVGKMLPLMVKNPFEVNIFDFFQTYLGETVMVYWLDRVRDMVKFDSIDELVDQLQKDERGSELEGWRVRVCYQFERVDE